MAASKPQVDDMWLQMAAAQMHGEMKSKNLSDQNIIAIDVRDVPEGVAPKDYIKQLGGKDKK